MERLFKIVRSERTSVSPLLPQHEDDFVRVFNGIRTELVSTLFFSSPQRSRAVKLLAFLLLTSTLATAQANFAGNFS